MNFQECHDTKKTWSRNYLDVFLLVIVLLQGMKWTIFVKWFTTTKMESNESKGGRLVINPWRWKTMPMEGWPITKGANVVDGEDSLHVHKYHMIQQTLLHTSTFVATNSHKTLASWYFWIWDDLLPKHPLGELEVEQDHHVCTKAHCNITNHYEIQICRNGLGLDLNNINKTILGWVGHIPMKMT
jgi:hypothetical protein